MFGNRDMKDSAIYRSYSKFIECNIIGNVAYERRYVVCIANAVIFVVLMNKQQNDNILETVLGTAKMLAEQTELDTEELGVCFSKRKEQILNFVSIVRKWNLTKYTANEILRILFEKYINKKETGAYYTDIQTTEYIARKTIVAYLLDDEIVGWDFCSILNDSNRIITMLDSLEKKKKKQMSEKLSKITILDPTCGTGAFLFAALEVLLEIYSKVFGISVQSNLIKHIFETNLFGVDIDEEAMDVLMFRVCLYCKLYWNLDDVLLDNFKRGNSLDSTDFDWQKTFTSIYSEQKGFDVLIGNPPYVEYSKMQNRYIEESIYKTYSCGNLYSYVLEKVILELSHNRSILGFVLPISIVSTRRMLPLRNLLISRTSDIAFANFSDRPACLVNGVHQKLSIMFAKCKTAKKKNDSKIYSSRYYHWNKEEQDSLLRTVTFHMVINRLELGIEKTSSDLETKVLEKVNSLSTLSLVDNFQKEKTSYSVWLNMRMAFWGKAFVHPMKSKEYKQIYFGTELDAKLFSAIMNSSLFYFVWECLSDCWHITSKELEFFKIDFSQVPQELKLKIASSYDCFERALEKSKVYIGSVQTSYIYQHKLHKDLLDEIDNLLASIFHLSSDELLFVKQYQINYRLNTEKK